jgi:Polyphosphate kinase 2 (PPK2)
MRLGIIDLGRMGANMVQQLQDYMETFEEALSATSTAWAPGYVIPADHKWVARFKAALEADYVVLGGGTPESWATCRLEPVWAITPMPSSAGSVCGRTPEPSIRRRHAP